MLRVSRRQAISRHHKAGRACPGGGLAEDWYLELRGKFKRGELDKLEEVNGEKTFEEAAEQFIREFPIMTEGQRNDAVCRGP